MKELELEPVALPSDEAALEHHRADQRPAVERSVARTPAIEAIEQNRAVAFGLARWPAWCVMVFRPENKLLVLAVVDSVDDLRAVYREDVAEFVPLELFDPHPNLWLSRHAASGMTATRPRSRDGAHRGVAPLATCNWVSVDEHPMSASQATSEARIPRGRRGQKQGSHAGQRFKNSP